jgi:hypothetical protein
LPLAQGFHQDYESRTSARLLKSPQLLDYCRGWPHYRLTGDICGKMFAVERHSVRIDVAFLRLRDVGPITCTEELQQIVSKGLASFSFVITEDYYQAMNMADFRVSASLTVL